MIGLLGAMTNWNERDLTLDFSFLSAGNYSAEVFKDGMNADRNARTKKRSINISSGDKVTIHLAPGGGWAARISAVK
jgi:alpha-glucosidase